MKKKTIAILGSTGSIGTSTLEIIKKDKKNHLSIMHSEIIKNKFKNID